MDNTKMPTGFKWIMAWYIVAVVNTFISLARFFQQLTSWQLIWTIISLILAMLVIAGIYLRRWGKLIVGWMVVGLVTGIFGLINFFAGFPAQLAADPRAQNLTPEQLHQGAQLFQVFGGLWAGLGLVLSLFILLYTYKRRDYFRS